MQLLCCIVLYCIVLYCIVLYSIVLYCIVSYYVVLCCIVLYCIVLYCIVLYCIVLYYIVLYRIRLYYPLYTHINRFLLFHSSESFLLFSFHIFQGDDGGSCIDGRLTSAWNWCSKLHKKPYYNVFMFTGFQGFDGDWKED